MVLWQKFRAALRNWLLQDSNPTMGGILHPATIDDGAGNLVERARAGDENAQALMAEIRDRTKMGKEGPAKARKAYWAMLEYIKKHPVKSLVHFGQDSVEIDKLCQNINFGDDYVEIVTQKVPEIASRSVNKAIVTLANGPSLLKSSLISDVHQSLEGSNAKAFKAGYQQGLSELNSIPKQLWMPFVLGHVLGTAKRIQAIRCPGVSLNVLSPALGMELE